MSNDIRIAVWDEEAKEFSEEGVTEFQYSESTRMVQFHITVLGTFALVKNRVIDFPYKRFNMAPYRDLNKMDNYEKMIRINIITGNVDLTIGITGSNCFIAKSTSKCLIDLLNKNMSPGRLIYTLQKRGVNLLPTTLDLSITKLDVMKVYIHVFICLYM